jgi:hypothetical protein
MRVLLACLIILGALIASTIGFAMWGASKVGRHVAIETSCKLLDAAEKEGWLSRSQRFDVIRQVTESATLRQPVRAAADRLRTGCPKPR